MEYTNINIREKDFDYRIRFIGQVVYNALRAIDNALGLKVNPPAWEDLSESYRLDMYARIVINYYSYPVKPENVHDVWVEKKKLMGYKQGIKKDHNRKTNPYLVRYEELHPDIKIKSIVHAAIVNSLFETLLIQDAFQPSEQAKDIDKELVKNTESKKTESVKAKKMQTKSTKAAKKK